MEQTKRLDFKKIAKMSFVLMIAIFIIQNLADLLFSKGYFYGGFPSSKLIWINLIIYYYLNSFIFLTVFIYIKNSLPNKLIKSGLIYGFIIWLFSNGIDAILYILNHFFSSANQSTIDSNYPPQAQAIEQIIQSIFYILSFMVIGIFISYINSKYISAKNNVETGK